MFQTGEVIRARVLGYPYIFHYGIIINYGGKTFIAHNPSKADGSPHPIIENIDDFWISRRFEKSFGVQTKKSAEQLLTKFKEIEFINYNYFLFNCEDFINKMIGRLRFQSGKIQLIIGIAIAVYLVTLIVKKIE